MKLMARFLRFTTMCLAAVFLLSARCEAAESGNLIDKDSVVSLWQPDDSKVDAVVCNENGEVVIKLDGSDLEDYMGFVSVNINTNKLFSIGNSDAMLITYSGLDDNTAFLTVQSNSIDSKKMQCEPSVYILGFGDKYYLNNSNQNNVKLNMDSATLLLSGKDFSKEESDGTGMYGITLNLGVIKGAELELRISDIQVVSNTYSFDEVYLTGKDTISAPNVGELWFSFTPVNFTPTKYELLNAGDGSSIDETGTITLTEDSKSTNARILCNYKDNYYVVKDVEIVGPDSYFSFLDPNKVKPIRYPFDFVTDNMIIIARIVGLVIIVGILTILLVINISIHKKEELEEDLQ